MKRIITISIFLLLAVFANAQDTLRLVFMGDIMQHIPQINAAQQANGTYNYDSCFHFVAPYIQNADFAVANLELTLAGKPYSGYPCFSAPDAIAEILQKIGFDLLSTANNHCCDKGATGVCRTIDVLDSLQIKHVGTFKNKDEKNAEYPKIVDVKNFKLAFISYTYDTNGMPVVKPTIANIIDTAQIAADIETAKQYNPDMIIAVMHWGIEYQLTQNQTQKQLAEFMTSRGVKLIIGSHPHVIQPMEAKTNTAGEIQTAVVYSLGNAVSNQNSVNSDIGAMAHITLVKNEKLETKISDCKYSLIWRYRKRQAGKKAEYYIIPDKDFYEKKDFFSAADYLSFKKTVDNTRKRLNTNNINFAEY